MLKLNSGALKIARTRNVKMPTRGTSGSAGIDFYVPNDYPESLCTVMPGERFFIPSGIKAKVPEGYALIAFNKSGVALKKGLVTGACVDGETIIETNKGKFTAATLTKEFIQQNDILLKSWNETTKSIELKKCDGFRVSNITETIKLEFDNGETIIVSNDHKLLTSNRGWVIAKELETTDEILLAE